MSSRPSSAPGLRLALSLIVAAGTPLASRAQIAGESVNMVSGTQWPGGDPFLQRQNEPSIAVSSANPQHLLAGANDYRTVDIPIRPGRRQRKMAADAWQGVFKSYDGGQTWKSYLMPGYPQDTSWDGTHSGRARPGWRGALQRGRRPGGPGGHRRHVLLRRHRLRAWHERRARRAQPVHRPQQQGERRSQWRYRLDPVGGRQGHRPGGHLVRRQALDRRRHPARWRAHLQHPEVRCVRQRLSGAPSGGAIYMVWARIYSDTSADVMFSRSLDCGDTWSAPLKLNDGKPGEPGRRRVGRPAHRLRLRRLAPVRGSRASPPQDEDAIFASRSFSKGHKFTRPRLLTSITPFEQAQDRPLALPHGGAPHHRLLGDSGRHPSWTHVAWAQRGADGDGQIVVSHRPGRSRRRPRTTRTTTPVTAGKSRPFPSTRRPSPTTPGTPSRAVTSSCPS